jgi:MFS family permease
MIGYFATAPIVGYWGDRLPRRGLIVAGVVAWCLGTLLTAWAHGLVSLICFRVLIGFGEASYGTLGPSWIAAAYPESQRNNAISLFYIAIPVGSALGFVLGGFMAALWGWRAAFLVAGVPALVLAALVMLQREPKRMARGKDAGGVVPALWEYLRLARIRPYRLVVLGYVAQTFALGGFGAWAAAFLERAHHMATRDADRFFGLALVVSGLVATLGGGAIGTWWQRRSRAGYASLLAVSAVLAVPFGFAAFLVASAALSKLCLVAAMLLLFTSTGPLNTLILETAPAALRASAMAASIFAIHLFGDLWSPLLVGWISDRAGSLRLAILVSLPPAIVICAVFWLVLARVMAVESRAS